MSWGEITDDALAAAAELIGQPLRRTRMQWIETATRDAIKHFAWGLGDDNPLWFDEEYAKASPAGSLLAPPCILYAVDSTIVAPKLPGVQWIYAGTDWTWYDHIRVDDSFRVEAELIKQVEKSGRRFPRWVLQTGQVRYYTKPDMLVATATGHCARTPRDGSASSEKEEDAQDLRYQPEDLAEIERQVLGETRQGAEPLYWEGVSVGDTVPPAVKGPLSIADILAWYSATQGALHYGGAHGDALRYRRRHDDYHINPATGAKDAAGRGHLETATARDVGMGAAYDVGPQRISWAQHMLCNWIGDHGFLHKLNVSVRRPNLVGDTIWWRGTVTGKRERGALKLLDIDVEARNQKDKSSAIGTAVVALPSHTEGPVPLPLEPGS
jgi:acyl dehydratase